MARYTLTLICPRCGRAFPSGMQMEPTKWEVIRKDLRVIEQCPHCGRSSPFSKTDYIFDVPS
jgi:rRNA maturation protein Nop10